MIVDLRAAEVPSDLDVDLCIAGGGPAGISIALQFIGSSQRVLLLEGGGKEFEDDSQSIYEGPLLGRPYFRLDRCRLRFFGGSSNHWGGMCRPLDPLDFEPRPWVPHSGWPIQGKDLEPFEAAAHGLLNLGPPAYDPGLLALDEGLILDLAPEPLVHSPFALSRPPTRFGKKYRRELDEAQNVEVFLHADLVDVELTDALNATTAFHVTTPQGGRLRVRARQFVLALGGIENPRLLLNADRQVRAGIGNQNDLVGRFFSDHPNRFAASIWTPQASAISRAYRSQRVSQTHVRHSIALSPEVQRREQTLNLAMTLHRSRDPKLSPGYLALQRAIDQVKNTEFSGLGQQMWDVIRDLDGTASDVYRWFAGTLETEVWAMVRCEQAPNPDSRVRLVEETDRLGLRRAGLDWHLGDLEKHTMKVAVQLLGQEAGRLGLGRVEVWDWLRDEGSTIEVDIKGGSHHMGTTRMADDPKRGVVDRDCRIHGNANLYVAGSSVFPTVGFANPTLTIVQLALRMAEHLKDRLAAA